MISYSTSSSKKTPKEKKAKKLKKLANKINIEITKMIHNSKDYYGGNKIPEGYTKEMNELQNKYRFVGKKKEGRIRFT